MKDYHSHHHQKNNSNKNLLLSMSFHHPRYNKNNKNNNNNSNNNNNGSSLFVLKLTTIILSILLLSHSIANSTAFFVSISASNKNNKNTYNNGQKQDMVVVTVPGFIRSIRALSLPPFDTMPDSRQCFISATSSSSSSSSSFLKMTTNNDDDDGDDDNEDDITLQNDNDKRSAVSAASNVLGTELCPCCTNVRNTGIGTGFYRNGYCSTGEQDFGRHTVCVQVTKDFLQYSQMVGNDLSTPAPQYMFPGLQENDYWCLCAERWVQAYQAGKAPKLLLQSTHEKTLNYISYDILRQYAIDQNESDQIVNNLNTVRDQLNKLLE